MVENDHLAEAYLAARRLVNSKPECFLVDEVDSRLPRFEGMTMLVDSITREKRGVMTVNMWSNERIVSEQINVGRDRWSRDFGIEAISGDLTDDLYRKSTERADTLWECAASEETAAHALFFDELLKRRFLYDNGRLIHLMPGVFNYLDREKDWGGLLEEVDLELPEGRGITLKNLRERAGWNGLGIGNA